MHLNVGWSYSHSQLHCLALVLEKLFVKLNQLSSTSNLDKKKSNYSTFIPHQSSYLSWISQIIFVEKKLSCGEISAFHVRQLWGNWKFWEILRIFGKFCHNLCAFIWRKFEPKSTFVEKKGQIWGLLKVGLVWIPYTIFAPQYFPELNCNKPLFEDPKSDSLNQRSGSTPKFK